MRQGPRPTQDGAGGTAVVEKREELSSVLSFLWSGMAERRSSLHKLEWTSKKPESPAGLGGTEVEFGGRMVRSFHEDHSVLAPALVVRKPHPGCVSRKADRRPASKT